MDGTRNCSGSAGILDNEKKEGEILGERKKKYRRFRTPPPLSLFLHIPTAISALWWPMSRDGGKEEDEKKCRTFSISERERERVDLT